MGYKVYRKLMVLFFMILLIGCKVNLYSGLVESDANIMVALLMANDVSVEKTPGSEGTWTITIDEKDMIRAVALLEANGLPKEKFTSLGQIFKKEGLISTPLEEKARFMFALGQEVASTIAQIDGVLTARVHIVPQEQDALGSNILPASASVFIKYTPEADLEAQVGRIKTMVENSIGGLKKENISIFLFQAMPPVTPPLIKSSRTTIFIGGGIVLLLIVGIGAFVFIQVQQNKANAEE